MKVTPKSRDPINFGQIGNKGLQQLLEKTGRLPPVSLVIKPLSGGKNPLKNTNPLTLTKFLSYNFSSSILIPVDTFSFNFVAPDSKTPLSQIINCGDIVTLYGNNIALATGIIDQTDTEVDNEFGEKGMLNGRDLMSQLEDNDAITLDSAPIYANGTSVKNAVESLLDNTRIAGVVLQGAPTGSNWLLATEPCESKLAALQRFLEPLNCISWMSPEGKIVIGRPNMGQRASGKLVLNKEARKANVLSMKVIRSETRIPGAVCPVWSGQEDALHAVSKSQLLMNTAQGPSRLWKLDHRVIKTTVVSTPQGSDPQSFAQINGITVSNFNPNKSGGGPILNAYATRELARQNQQELIVQVMVPGHYNEQGDPYKVDTVYTIDFDRGDVLENMYLFQTDYSLTLEGGQRTSLYFCRLGTIVADIIAPGRSNSAGISTTTGGQVA